MPTLILLFIYVVSLSAQHDAVWLLGGTSTYSQQGSQLDFKGDSLQIKAFTLPFGFDQIGGLTMADEEGQLLFYTNGCQIRNARHQLMAESAGFQEENRMNGYCGARLGAYPLTQGLLALPEPGFPGYYLLLHLRMDEGGRLSDLLFTRINMHANEGLGRVEEKNVLLLQDQLADQLTATRHCNGMDWWLLLPHHASAGYYRFLLTATGFSGPRYQDIGPVWPTADANGQAVFSPDGSYYFRTNASAGLARFDFDPCTGLLNNPVFIPAEEDQGLAAGVSVSHNSRYVYHSYSSILYQYDLWADDFGASRQEIDRYDGFRSPYPVTFFQHRLAPDGRIYLSASNRSDYLHVIQQPEEAGPACRFEQHAIVLPAAHRFGLPNMPFYGRNSEVVDQQ